MENKIHVWNHQPDEYGMATQRKQKKNIPSDGMMRKELSSLPELPGLPSRMRIFHMQTWGCEPEQRWGFHHQ